MLFSGDLGRYGQPILNDPETPPRADVVLCESTYGDREHPSVPPPDQALADVINRVAKRGGVIVVPAFAVDRTQLLLYYLRQLEDANRIPRLPVYMDSPMAIDVTRSICAIARIHDVKIHRRRSRRQSVRRAQPAHHAQRARSPSRSTTCTRRPSLFPPAAWLPAGA